MTTVGQVGEFALIDRLARGLAGGAGVALGIGDDTAVLETTPGLRLLATVDGQVEGVHFLRDGTPARAVGHRALATNLSDIAAMGGRPRWALVALALPADLPLVWMDDFYEGLGTLAREHGIGVVGGNLARTEGQIVADVTVLGEVGSDQVLTRKGARPGDGVFVTGWPGESAGGLELILRPELREGLSPAAADRLLGAHWTPTPRIREGMALAASGVVTSAIDVSDGLAADLGHVLEASGVGATLDEDALPMSSALRELAGRGGPSAERLTLHGGEAYELLFTCDRRQVRRLGVGATLIGTIDVEAGLRLRRGGAVESIGAAGHDHFERGQASA